MGVSQYSCYFRHTKGLKMKIELPDEIVEFMMALAKEIKEQDNRATASPYYYIVQGKREVIAPAGYGDADYVYYNPEWGEAYSKEGWEKILENEEGEEPVDIEEFISKKCEEFGLHLVDVEENVFLTFKGYEQHMGLNKHNYRHLKDVHSYVKYAGRNPEMEMLLKSIRAFGDLQKEGDE